MDEATHPDEPGPWVGSVVDDDLEHFVSPDADDAEQVAQLHARAVDAEPDVAPDVADDDLDDLLAEVPAVADAHADADHEPSLAELDLDEVPDEVGAPGGPGALGDVVDDLLASEVWSSEDDEEASAVASHASMATHLERADLEDTTITDTGLDDTRLDDTALDDTALDGTRLDETGLEVPALDGTGLEGTELADPGLGDTDVDMTGTAATAVDDDPEPWHPDWLDDAEDVLAAEDWSPVGSEEAAADGDVPEAWSAEASYDASVAADGSPVVDDDAEHTDALLAALGHDLPEPAALEETRSEDVASSDEDEVTPDDGGPTFVDPADLPPPAAEPGNEIEAIDLGFFVARGTARRSGGLLGRFRS